jgi:hypothetical protein
MEDQYISLLPVGSTVTGTESIPADQGSDTVRITPVQITTFAASEVKTLTNKRIRERVDSTASDATPRIDVDLFDCFTITALATSITDFLITGTPTNFQTLVIRIKDNGTARGITMGTNFVAMGASLPTTTVVSKLMHIVCIYDSVQSKWGVTAVIQEA